MKSFGITDKGSVRSENQDRFLIEKCEAKKSLIIALCDGMGGAKAGSIASELSVKSFVNYVYARLTSRRSFRVDFKQVLLDAVAETNTTTCDYSKIDEAYAGMGTTLVGGLINSTGKGFIVNVGDSRAYHISRRGKSIYQITKDHSLVEDLVDSGIITREQSYKHRYKNVITRAIGPEPKVEADYFEFKLDTEDILLLCSDGLSNIITDIELLNYTMEYKEPELFCRSLMSKALLRGANDNVTLLAVMK